MDTRERMMEELDLTRGSLVMMAGWVGPWGFLRREEPVKLPQQRKSPCFKEACCKSFAEKLDNEELWFLWITSLDLYHMGNKT